MAAASGGGGGGASFKERTFADFDIDPLSLDAEGNDKVLDLIEENNTLSHEVSFPCPCAARLGAGNKVYAEGVAKMMSSSRRTTRCCSSRSCRRIVMWHNQPHDELGSMLHGIGKAGEPPRQTPVVKTNQCCCSAGAGAAIAAGAVGGGRPRRRQRAVARRHRRDAGEPSSPRIPAANEP